MKVGDLVRHTMLKETRQAGIITETLQMFTTADKKYKVLWAGIHTEEYWFTKEELGPLG